ncbi:MAG: hypothetical protein HYY84_01480, partial [Deltaproteobacteria bacterium]|nr:hypothetical protein [Deltaproteobacteria bacterium]
CGSVTNNCGQTVSCGTCSGTGQSCVSNVCSCTPANTTACAGKNCGSVTNNCGQTVSCGTCSGTGESCVSNVCSCTPTTCAAQGKNCGSISDGCGGTLSCGTCAPASCTGLTRTFATSCAANVCTAPTPATENCDDGNATTGDYCAASGCIHVAAPTTAPDLDATSDTGTSPTDNITNDTTPTVIGTVAASTLVRIYEGTTLLGSVTSNATTGAYSITTSALADGTHTLVARIVDAAGNESTNSPSLSVTIDTTAPLQPGTPTLSVAAINSTGSSTVSWTAATDTGGSGIRRYYLERNFNGTGFAEIATPTSPSYTQSGTGLTGGSYTYRVLAEDNAGNLGATYSSPSAALTVITLNAITPAMANTGDTITLEGVFGSSATVNFPGATASATMQGTGSIRYRATVLVPAAATAGDLNVTTAGASTDALPFRRVSFTLGAQPPRPHYEQTGYAQQMRGLSPARRGHCNVVVPRGPANTFVYVMGGIAASSLTTVERARVNADGSLGSFGTIAGVSLVTRRYGFACAVIGDYIYVFGGYDGSSPLRSIERAPIDANGLITTFVTVPTGESQLTIARWLHSIVVVGTNIYVIGGQTTGGTDRSDVEAATINADGTIGNFAASTAALTATNRSHAAVVADNYVYILGGYKAGTVSRAIERASIGGTGSLGSFTAITTTLVTGRAMHTATIVGDKLLVVGGRVQSTDVIDSIEQSTIATNGNVGTFSVVQNLDSAREWHTAVVAGNHLYVVGGALTSGYTGAVERLEANSAGSISALSATSGAVLATPRDSHCAIVVGDSIYVIGRRTYSGSLTSGTQVTERAIVAANGTFGNFASFSGANLSSGRYRHACAIAGNYVYAIGGATGSGGTKLTTIERATIGTDGTLGGFTGISIALAVGREGHRAFFAGRRLYIVGGNVSSGSSTTIEYADVDATGALPASGTFTISGRTLSRNRYLPAVAVIGGTVNVMGGANGTAQELYVDQATIDTAGTALGAFTHNTAISINTGGFGRVAAFAGGALYVLGGGAAFTSRLNPTPTYNRREVATVNATNTLGDFVSEADDAAHNLLTPRFAAAPIVINNTLYIIGGYNDGSSPDQLSSIEQATLQ